MTRDERIAYAAGLFDGEGYVGIELVPRLRARAVLLTLAVQMKTPFGPQFFAETFGGRIHFCDPPSRTALYRWRVTSGRAAAVLRELRPFLREKAAQVDLCLEGRAIQENRPQGQGARYRPEDRARVTVIHQQVKALKRA